MVFKWIRCLSLLLFCACFCAACSSLHHYKRPIPVRYPHTQGKYFNSIDCHGPFTVTLTNTRSKTQHGKVSLQGEGVTGYVEGQTLYLREIPIRQQKTGRRAYGIVYIRGASLKHLRVAGQCQVNMRNAPGYGLIVHASGRGRVTIRGVVPLRKIETNDKARVDARWVKSHDLTVHVLGQSHVRLAGVANTMHARVFGEGFFDGKYLRVKQVYVQTAERGVAKVLPKVALRAFALGSSQIYYYKTPGPNLKLTRFSGNVLQMGYWN